MNSNLLNTRGQRRLGWGIPLVVACAGLLGWLIFSGVDFGWGHLIKYRGGPDIPLTGSESWVLPSPDDFNDGDVRHAEHHGHSLISAVLVRDAGNYVFMRVELLNDFQLERGEGKDLILVFSWKAGDGEEPIPGLPVRIMVEGGWQAAVLIRGNASSGLWGNGIGEISPTHVFRTYFDRAQATVTLGFSKLLLVSAGWDGRAPVRTTAIIFRDGSDKIRDFEPLGSLESTRWGTGGWIWNPVWVAAGLREAP